MPDEHRLLCLAKCSFEELYYPNIHDAMLNQIVLCLTTCSNCTYLVGFYGVIIVLLLPLLGFFVRTKKEPVVFGFYLTLPLPLGIALPSTISLASCFPSNVNSPVLDHTLSASFTSGHGLFYSDSRVSQAFRKYNVTQNMTHLRI